jgi:hypothetical protein
LDLKFIPDHGHDWDDDRSHSLRPLTAFTSGRPNRNSNETELIQGSHPVSQHDFLSDFSGLEPNGAHAGKPHFPA